MALLLSRFRVVTNQLRADVTVDGVMQTITVAAGTYYLDSSTGSESLVTAIDSALESAHAPENFTVTFDMATGKITVSCTTLAGVWGWAWNTGAYGTEFRDLCGATGDFGPIAGANYTFANPCQYVIKPGSGRADFPGHPRKFSGVLDEAESGVSAFVGSTVHRRKSRWLHEYEAATYVASPWESGTWDDAAAVVPWVWDDFWIHHATTGQPFRYYADGAAIGAPENTYRLRNFSAYEPARIEPGSDAYWGVNLEVLPYMVAT